MALPTQPDNLTALPVELITKVASNLPSAAIFSLSQTSTGLRNVLAENASAICNEALRTRFPELVKRLKCELKDGWLVPTHPWLAELEDEVAFTHWRIHGYYWAWNADAKVAVRIRISDPGPAFFYMMEKKRKFVVLKENRGEEPPSCVFLESWRLNFDDFRRKTEDPDLYISLEAVSTGLMWINDNGFASIEMPSDHQGLCFYRGDTTRETGTRSKVKAMIWYYGLSKHVVLPSEVSGPYGAFAGLLKIVEDSISEERRILLERVASPLGEPGLDSLKPVDEPEKVIPRQRH